MKQEHRGLVAVQVAIAAAALIAALPIIDPILVVSILAATAFGAWLGRALLADPSAR